MHPILFAALHGLAKGLVSKGAGSVGDPLHTVVMAPVREELAYRAPLANAAPSALNEISSAVAFGLAHFDPAEPPGHRALRVIDAGVGGLVYSRAMRGGGIGDAIFAHALHNAMVSVGSAAARAKTKRAKRVKPKGAKP